MEDISTKESLPPNRQMLDLPSDLDYNLKAKVALSELRSMGFRRLDDQTRSIYRVLTLENDDLQSKTAVADFDAPCRESNSLS